MWPKNPRSAEPKAKVEATNEVVFEIGVPLRCFFAFQRTSKVPSEKKSSFRPQSELPKSKAEDKLFFILDFKILKGSSAPLGRLLGSFPSS